MKFSFLLIPLLFLASCTNSGNNETLSKIQSLETKVITLEKENKNLKIENANLKEESNLIKAGWIPPENKQPSGLPPWMTGVSDGSMFPEWTTFEESNGATCMKKAKDNFMTAGIKKCTELGYKKADIQANKCQLDTSFINELNAKKKDAEAQCGPM